jgi:hypothetical protein
LVSEDPPTRRAERPQARLNSKPEEVVDTHEECQDPSDTDQTASEVAKVQIAVLEIPCNVRQSGSPAQGEDEQDTKGDGISHDRDDDMVRPGEDEPEAARELGMVQPGMVSLRESEIEVGK